MEGTTPTLLEGTRHALGKHNRPTYKHTNTDTTYSYTAHLLRHNAYSLGLETQCIVLEGTRHTLGGNKAISYGALGLISWKSYKVYSFKKHIQYRYNLGVNKSNYSIIRHKDYSLGSFKDKKRVREKLE